MLGSNNHVVLQQVIEYLLLLKLDLSKYMACVKYLMADIYILCFDIVSKKCKDTKCRRGEAIL